jgi:hypothetical protein
VKLRNNGVRNIRLRYTQSALEMVFDIGLILEYYKNIENSSLIFVFYFKEYLMKTFGWVIKKDSEIFQIRNNEEIIEEISFSRFMKGNEHEKITAPKCQKLCEKYGLQYDPMQAEEY